MFCNECGHENRNDRKFCAECGNPLRDYTKEIPKEELLMPEDIQLKKDLVEKRNNALKICSIIFYCLLVAGALLTAISFFTKDAVQLVIISIATGCFVGLLVVRIVSKSITSKANKKMKNK